MKSLLFYFFLFVFSAAFVGESFSAEPVLETSCQPGGGFGNVVTLKLSKDFRYGKLTIKRTLAGSDLTRDVSTFLGGNYRLDIASKGGITGYSLEYSAKDPTAAFATTEGTISCASVPVAATPEPAQPISAPQPVPQVPIAPVTTPTEPPTVPKPTTSPPSPVEPAQPVAPPVSSAAPSAATSGITAEAGRLPSSATSTTSTTPAPVVTGPVEPAQPAQSAPSPSEVPFAPPTPQPQTTTEPDLE